MAYHPNLHLAFLDAHSAVGNLAGSWFDPDFGDKTDIKRLGHAIGNLRLALDHAEAALVEFSPKEAEE